MHRRLPAALPEVHRSCPTCLAPDRPCAAVAGFARAGTGPARRVTRPLPDPASPAAEPGRRHGTDARAGRPGTRVLRSQREEIPVLKHLDGVQEAPPLLAIRHLVLGDEAGGNPAPVLDVNTPGLGPFPYLLGIDAVYRGTAGTGRTPPRPGDPAGLADVRSSEFPQLPGVTGIQVNLIPGAVKPEFDGLDRRTAVDIIDKEGYSGDSVELQANYC